MGDVVIVEAVRTAVGAFGGSLKGTPAVKLGQVVIEQVLSRAGLSPECVDQVIFGNVLQAGLGQNPARQAGIFAGIPQEKPAFTINMVCGSGLKSVNIGAQTIQSGDADVVIAGGMENMSRAPYISQSTRWGARMGEVTMTDTMINDGLWCAFNDVHMGITAENIAKKYCISREEQDIFALRSQQRAEAALKNGRFKQEIVPIEIKEKKKQFNFEHDEYIKLNTTLETLSGLKPAFIKEGTVTAGNASGLNDGAAVILLMSSQKAQELGMRPLAIIRGSAEVGVDPAVMGIGPIPATLKALKKAGLSVSDLDLIEANEAFAAQAIAVSKELDFDPEITNVNGGAIAIGHPIGASGARILVTLLHEMKRKGASKGLATLCVGGGQGLATVVEMA